MRGGAERGRQWYADGKLDCKPNSVADFAAAARHLVERGYTTPALLAASATSAGGVVVAAAANSDPELLRAAVLRVPFVDVVTAMSDDRYEPSLLITISLTLAVTINS